MRVGAILRACRTRANFTQAELADELFISQSDVSKYENDTMEPHLSTLQAWTSSTQTTEVLVAFLMGLDGLGIMQTILEMGTNLVGGITWNVIKGSVLFIA